MTDAQFWRRIRALLEKTVDRGATAAEEAAARAKISELVTKYGNFIETTETPRLSIIDRIRFGLFANPRVIGFWFRATFFLGTWRWR